MNPQLIAADPQSSIFVTANAGSGKTSTLVNRVARLLLSGSRPEHIICVTYTKAAAAEMQSRLFQRLGQWAIMDDEALRADLAKIDEQGRNLGEARALFARALETPGGLKIQTLHAFCERLLRRFPLEAGLSATFQVLDDIKKQALLDKARDTLLCFNEDDGFRDRLIKTLGPKGFESLLTQFSSQMDALTTVLGRLREGHGEDWPTWIYQQFDLSGVVTPKNIADHFAQSLDWDQIRAVGASMAQAKGANNQKTGYKLAAIAEAYGCDQSFDLFAYYRVFYTLEGTFSKNTFSKEAPEADKILLQQLSEPIPAILDQQRAATIASQTCDAMALFALYRSFYLGFKAQTGALDFQDIITAARDLLLRPDMSDWVLYKLDGGLDHILVDEAQDTNPDQWQIVSALSDAFFHDDEEKVRTVFAVGDEKQSIFGFQGARPDAFLSMRRAFGDKAFRANKDFAVPALETSYRSLPQILQFVDATFATPALADALSPGTHVISHSAHRKDAEGCVELWPLVLPYDKPNDAIIDDDDDMAAPDALSQDAADLRLAREVAHQISQELKSGRCIYDSDGPRPMREGDILILTRTRNALFNAIIRELKISGVAVSGADRLVLEGHIAFQDIRALMRFCAQPADALSLACVLRSPFCDLNEDDLYHLALEAKTKGGLWAALCAKGDEDGPFHDARAFLGWALHESNQACAFDFLSRALNRRDANGLSQKHRFLRRLGRECEDVLDETLSLAQSCEGLGLTSLYAFLHHCEAQSNTIKREQDEGQGRVRVMTVHGSKGLEAHWVILAMAPHHKKSSQEPLFLSDDGDIGLIPSVKAQYCDQVKAYLQDREIGLEAEALRLFYVALTRARDRLSLCGYKGRKDPTSHYPSWYELAQQGMQNLIPKGAHPYGVTGQIVFDPQSDTQPSAMRFGTLAPIMKHDEPSLFQSPRLPEFLRAPLNETKSQTIGWRAASQLDQDSLGQDEVAPSPLGGVAGLGRYRRGELIHKLFEILPDLPKKDREACAIDYLRRRHGLAEHHVDDITKSVLGVLNDARFSMVFAEGSRAEIALAGQIGAEPGFMLSGRVDRLVVTPTEVLVVDFKSNRPAPDSAHLASLAIQRQMAGYVGLLRQIYPRHKVSATLLWTDGPKLTPFDDDLIALRLQDLMTPSSLITN